MLALEGVYQNGQLLLPQKIEFTQPIKVIVTFLEEEKITQNKVTEKLVAELYSNDNITFKQAQSLLNHQNWQDTVTVLELECCQLHYDKDDWEEDLETLALFDEKENSR
jgi:predicted HTH domain antitoxin